MKDITKRNCAMSQVSIKLSLSEDFFLKKKICHCLVEVHTHLRPGGAKSGIHSRKTSVSGIHEKQHCLHPWPQYFIFKCSECHSDIKSVTCDSIACLKFPCIPAAGKREPTTPHFQDDPLMTFQRVHEYVERLLERNFPELRVQSILNDLNKVFH